MEKIEWLIDKLRRQYDSAAGAPAMLTTLQLLQLELTGQTSAAPTAIGKIAVIMPAPQWNTNSDGLLDAYDAEVNRGEDEKKMVFELEPYVGGNEEIQENEPEQTTEEETAEQNEIVESPIAVSEPFVQVAVEEVKPEPVPVRQISVEMPPNIYASYLPEQKKEEPKPPEITPLPAGEIPPSVTAVEMPKPVPDTDKKSLNDLLEKPASEMYVRFQEPIKDLKKAISINDRYQYINSLFSGDEASFDRSVKTINNFNVFSEAEYWMRRELATRYGWEEGDQLVQQFYGLVSRRFS